MSIHDGHHQIVMKGAHDDGRVTRNIGGGSWRHGPKMSGRYNNGKAWKDNQSIENME
jgi:hypothetical protein